jgi:catechol 2,3-dioxygenase-like lactoylglutathione lyase family enzyme
MGLLKIEGVTHWSIPVNNLDEAEKFYGDLLGLKHLGRLGNSGMSCFNVGDNNILLCERAASVDKSHVEEQNVHHSFTVAPETLVQDFCREKNSYRPAVLPGQRIFYGQGALFLRSQRQSPGTARSDLEGRDARADF